MGKETTAFSLERKLPGRCTSDSSAVLAPKTGHVLPLSLLEASIIEISDAIIQSKIFKILISRTLELGRFSTVEEWECTLGGGLAEEPLGCCAEAGESNHRISSTFSSAVVAMLFLPQLLTKRGKRRSCWWWWWWKPALSIFRGIALENWLLKYIAIKRPVGEDLTVGAKQNLTILLASGQYMVNFDEDDLYADRYVERMGTVMQQRILVAVTLSGWHNFFEARGPAGYSEPNSWDPEDEDEMDEILYHIEFHPFHPRLLDYGSGFSYVHLRVMALFFPYPNLAFAETP